MGVNMEDEELVKMFNLTLKRRETILFFLIVVINGLTWIVSDIGLDTCARERWRVEIIEKFLARKGDLFGGTLGLNTLCRGHSSHTKLVGLLYPWETSQRRSAPVTKFSQLRVAPVTKFSQLRAWISLKRASATP